MKINRRIAAAIFAFALMVVNMNIYFAAENDQTLNETEVKAEDEKTIIPVLMYHNLAESYPQSTDGANITPKRFEEHMLGILERGYTPIFVADYYNCVERNKELPPNPIIITFDDGYLSNYELAYPILKKLNIPATIFIVTSTVGETVEGGKVSYPHFTWEQAREMQNSGLIDIHSHSHYHKDMTSLTQAQLQEDLRLSRYLIERNLNKNGYVFSYPFGRYNEKTSRLARLAGYRMQILVNYAESGQDYLANDISKGLDHFTRLTVHGSMSTEDLFGMIDKAVENTNKLYKGSF